jgi:hypothetical protein
LDRIEERAKDNINFYIKVKIRCLGTINNHIHDLSAFLRMAPGTSNFLPHFFINYNTRSMLEVNIRCARVD